jgi:hypothetical protein
MEPEGNFGALSAINGSKNGSKFGRGEPFLKPRIGVRVSPGNAANFAPFLHPSFLLIGELLLLLLTQKSEAHGGASRDRKARKPVALHRLLTPSRFGLEDGTYTRAGRAAVQNTSILSRVLLTSAEVRPLASAKLRCERNSLQILGDVRHS